MRQRPSVLHFETLSIEIVLLLWSTCCRAKEGGFASQAQSISRRAHRVAPAMPLCALVPTAVRSGEAKVVCKVTSKVAG
ncbi:uncharacterized protein B0I36DRAFT_319776 [Microdochium trichocladiopsis]|uniref:Secreted protein n=1 Tax=Microdochium trichocladiopsis TaxID=1682393 RepID=A0A9P8Y5V8_9PEZI|nr:uncharacterized protein B0I36DRAFT_319776 [Microdochium trichocladiopsis]KAH7032640.1 hypothetical protein B0I36DRAFT_319776 [Microdochium trichocladiopsis]